MALRDYKTDGDNEIKLTDSSSSTSDGQQEEEK